jgi:hypothetical protein
MSGGSVISEHNDDVGLLRRCAVAGPLATVTTTSEANEPRQMRLFTRIFQLPCWQFAALCSRIVKPSQRPLAMRKRHGLTTAEPSMGCRLLADIVAKVENRSAPKIWRKLILGYLRGCVTFQRHWEGPWLILDETIWSPTSARPKCISGSENFRPSPQKDFCNSIGTFETSQSQLGMSAYRGGPEVDGQPPKRRD